MADERDRIRGDIALPPNEFLFASDETKGIINTYVGPVKVSLSNTEQAVIFRVETKRFESVPLERARQLFATAPEGWYIIMKNPSKSEKEPHPRSATSSTLGNDLLDIGKKINIPGPCSFPLWPGQMVKVVAGHRLRSNQYLVVRVYDASAAEKNFDGSIFSSETKKPDDKQEIKLATGQLFIIRGTNVSFFIPPTGFEVVPDSTLADGKPNFVRDAVSLEQLEYCILLDENGEKDYRYGFDKEVVFPEPTQSFIKGKDGSVKFRAYELNEISGLYIKVIAPYEEGEGEKKVKHEVGEEIFITGKDERSRIYFPRPEHALVTYGDQDKHHAVAIPAGEGRYVMDRRNGPITIKPGPAMFLADPRGEVIVRRVLDQNTVGLWYPGNQEAIEYNKNLSLLSSGGKESDFVTDQMVRSTLGAKSSLAAEHSHGSFVADDFRRGTEYTPPRTITLNTKFEGVPSINIWTGYAVQVVSKTGKRRVVTGPQSILLEYDETLEAMELSKGTPKTDKNTLKTVYLKVLGNKVSDQVTAETQDFCQVQTTLSYRVNFEGEDSNKWFNVENYVKFLTEHARSLIRNAVKKHGIEEFYQDSISIIRDAILGPSADGKRPGRLFEENNMRIYDIEVLEVTIGDSTISELLKTAQHSSVREAFTIAAKRREVERVKEMEGFEVEILDEKAETEKARITRETEKLAGQLELDKKIVDQKIQLLEDELKRKLTLEDGENKLNDQKLAREKKEKEQKLELSEKEMNQRIQELKAESDAITKKMEAITPNLIAALQAIGDKDLIARVAESMAPLALLEGNSVADALNKLTRGTTVEALVGQLMNGKAKELTQ